MNALLRSLPLMRSCKEAAALMVAREDRALRATERWALRVHLSMCKACPNFEAQLLTMRTAMRQWRHYSEQESEQQSERDGA
ncbi:MAG: zf-HC2 domain-containing protein [Hydrogenophaga sp.]|nr:zf-HC2 domain-containing protein [Hydrogenophaga sp.]